MLKLRLEHDPRLPVMRGNWHGTAVAMDSRDARGAVRRTHAEEELMKTPGVLITGALTGIGGATARAFATEGARVVVSGRRDDEANGWSPSYASSARKPCFCAPTCAARTTCAGWSTRPSLASAGWMRPSTPPAPKASPAP